MLRGQQFVALPCGCAARLSLQPDRIAVQLVILHSPGHTPTDKTPEASCSLADGEAVLVSIGISSTSVFAAHANTVELDRAVSQAAQV